MAERKKKIGIKMIRKALSDCALDPTKPGWFKIVADANNNYLVLRSIELLQELLIGATTEKLHQAISLLGIVKARFDETVQTKS